MITKNKFDEKKIIAFTLILSTIASTTKLAFFNTNIYLMPILNILLILLGNLFIFKFNMIDSLINSILCSIISFTVSTISLLTNIPPINEINLSIKILLLSTFFALLYKIFYIDKLQELLIKIKAAINNSNELSLLIFLITLSFDTSLFYDTKTAFSIFFIQLAILSHEIYKIYKNIEINEITLKFYALTVQNYSIQSLLDKVRTFKHDYNNTVCAIGGYISLNDMSGLKNYYSRLNYDINCTNNLQLINIKNINEPSIYNILSSKHQIILQNNIKFDFYSTINYKSLSIPPYELSKILGILLDNAIDAAILSSEKEISLTCKNYNKKSYQIILKNTYINKDVNIKDIYQKGYSTKSIKSGLGLWEVSKIMESFPNISLSTKKDDDYFTQLLYIPIKENF